MTRPAGDPPESPGGSAEPDYTDQGEIADALRGADVDDGEASQRGAAFRRALDRLPRRESAPPATPSVSTNGGHGNGNGLGNGNGHRTPGGAPPKITSADEITAPRLEASLAKLLRTAPRARTGRREPEPPSKRSHTLPPPPTKTARRTPDRSKTKVTRIVAPRPPTETASVTKLPPLNPTKLVKAPPKPPAPKKPAPPAPTPGPPPSPKVSTPPAAAAAKPAPVEAISPKISAELADILGNADTAAIKPPAAPPAGAPLSVPGETTKEFESLLEGLLDGRDTAIPSEPAAQPLSTAAGPSDETGAFSVDTPIFKGPSGNEGNLSDFVSKILNEFDTILDEPGAGDGGASAPGAPVDAGAAPPGAPLGRKRNQRETVAFEEAFEAMQSGGRDDRETRSEPLPAAKDRPPGKDTRASRETGEFEDGEATGPSITPDELSQLSDLFNED